MPLSIWVERARGLPRPRLLRAPSPYVEVHYFAGAPPVGVSPPVERESAPEWPGFCARVATAPADGPPLTFGVVVRDAGSRGAVLGRCSVRVAASVTEGWFSLDSDVVLSPTASADGETGWTAPKDPDAYTHAAAEVYLRVEWPEYCELQRWEREALEMTEPDGDMDSELRCVSDEPGRFFRCGEMHVAVRAMGVPVATRDPQLTLKTHDQQLRGFEALPKPASPSQRVGGASAAGQEERIFRPVLTKKEYVEAKKAGTRRQVDFGLFTFAMFQGVFPDTLKLTIRERGAHKLHAVTALLKSVAEQTIPLPTRIPGYDDKVVKAMPRDSDVAKSIREDYGDGRQDGESDSATSSYVMHFRSTSPGASSDKVIFDVRITYNLWRPPASSNIVTPRFQELMADMEELAPQFKSKYPVSMSLTYLFVGGLFTDHYPKYFFFNNSFLAEDLALTNVGTVPIHTEYSVDSNAKIIRDAVVEAAGGTRSVVLISHSKGGCDVCGAIARYPELQDLLYGLISYQAPFAGTYLVGFVSKSTLAINTIVGAIKKLWGGESDAFIDMGYASRLRDVLFGGNEEIDADEDGVGPSDAAAEGFHVNLKAEDVIETDIPDAMGSLTVSAETPFGSQVCILDDANVSERLRIYGSIPTVCFSSSAPYSVSKVRSVANAAGFASMAPAAQVISAHTGFSNDGLVAPCDARIPYGDLVYLTDMMHTEPALFFAGSKYPPGKLTAAGIALLIEKNARRSNDFSEINTR